MDDLPRRRAAIPAVRLISVKRILTAQLIWMRERPRIDSGRSPNKPAHAPSKPEYP